MSAFSAAAQDEDGDIIKTLKARVADLEAQLYAVGAGGVGKLEQPQSVTNCHQSQPQGEQEPVAYYVMNGAALFQLFRSKSQADALAYDLQKRHDLSGSLAHFHVVPLYTHPQPKREPLDTDTWPECPAPSVRPVYAISANTKSVRDGFEVGGYEKTPPLFTKSQLYDYALNVLRAHGIGGEK